MIYGGMNFLQGVTINATSKCNRRCKYCMVKEYMQAYPDYAMTMAQFHKFMMVSWESGYVFDFMNFSGGDALLWEPLETALDLVKQYPVAKETTIFTNGLLISEENEKKLVRLASKSNNFKISYTGENMPQIHLATRMFGGLTNILTSDQRYHYKRPVGPVPGSIPAICGVNTIGVIRDQVYVCANCHIQLHNFPQFDSTGLYTEVKERYLDYLDMAGRLNKPYCTVCVSNQKLVDHLERGLNKEWGW